MAKRIDSAPLLEADELAVDSFYTADYLATIRLLDGLGRSHRAVEAWGSHIFILFFFLLEQAP